MKVNQQRVIQALAVLAGIAVLLGVIQLSVSSREALPLEVSHKVRNLSAKETEWQLATAAQPGDVLEHFVLIRLSSDYSESIGSIFVSVETSEKHKYRLDSYTSRSLGSNNDSLITKNGITIPKLAPGEFADLVWQTSVAENSTFKQNEAPLLSSVVTVSVDGFSKFTSRTVASLFSTLERSKVLIADERYYAPKAYSMNPRQAYQDLGSGVLIAGEDFEGVTGLSIKEASRAMVWRLVSNELLEASIPAGLTPGEYTIELTDSNNKVLANTLDFTIISSQERAVVIAATPNIIRAREQRTLVLQGIRLGEGLQFSLSKQGSNQIYALENPLQINERVLTAEVPNTITPGTYTILVGENKQEAHITVN